MNKRPVLVLLTSHWLSMLGAALVTLAGFSWLFVLPLNVSGHVSNPYIGLLVFIAIPLVFFAGLALIPIGVAFASQLTYRAVEHMDTVQFCGATCHVMKPEFTAHAAEPPHQAVACAECHIAPGATGFVKAKMNGTHQLMNVIFNSYPRPIESAIESGKLVSSAETCEHCHARDKPISPRLRV